MYQNFVEDGFGGRDGRGRKRRARHMMRGAGKGRGRGHGSGGGRGPGRGRRRRLLDHGDLRLLMLALISETPRHGYELIREIEARTGGAYVPSPGVIYPALEALLDLGWIDADSDGARRVFKLASDGTAKLAEEAEALARIEARLAELQESDRPEESGDVISAMRRLKHTVMHVLQDEPSGSTRHKAVTDILAEAQARISGLED